jgi:hypothetical protein
MGCIKRFRLVEVGTVIILVCDDWHALSGKAWKHDFTTHPEWFLTYKTAIFTNQKGIYFGQPKGILTISYCKYKSPNGFEKEQKQLYYSLF